MPAQTVLRAHRRVLLVVVLALLAALVAVVRPDPAAADRPAGPAVVRELVGDAPPPPATGESSVTLLVRDATGAAAQSARAQLAASAAAPVRSDGDAATRRALLRSTRLAVAERAAAGDAVRRFATAHRLRVVDDAAGYVTVAGDLTSLATAFGARLHDVTANGRAWRVAASPIVVPSALAAHFRAAHGLDDRPVVRPRAIPGGYEGRHMRAAYRVPTSSRLGAGTTVGSIQFSGWDASDVTTYAGEAGIALSPGQIAEVSINSTDPAQHDSSGGAFEVAMDVESILSVAPAARQRVYFTSNTFAGTVAAYTRMAQDAEAGLLTVASTSWGGCEQLVSSGAAADVATAIRRLIAAGATLTAASGDAGAYDCSVASAPDSRLAVDFPASLPEVVAVGGTTLPPIAPGDFTPDVANERAWGVDGGDFPAYQGDGSGGGASIRYTRPAYQAGIPIAGTTRLVPDLALLGDAETGLAVYVGSEGGWFTGGGTSLAAPLFAGLLADAASDAQRTSGPGDIHAAMYVNQQAFRDITTGQNNQYAATDGYDRVTGLGAPIMELLAPAIGLSPGGPSPSPTVTPTSTSSPSPTAPPQAPTLVAQTTATAGVLITVSGTAAPGAEVELWGVTAPNGTITRVNTPTVLADASGQWSKVIRPLRNVNLQARVGSAVSGTRFIAVSTAVKESVAPLAGCIVQVAGSVFEPKPGRTVFIRAVDAAGRTVSLGTGSVQADGRFLLRKPYACGQRLAVYTVIEGDNVNRPGATGTQVVTTRR